MPPHLFFFWHAPTFLFCVMPPHFFLFGMPPHLFWHTCPHISFWHTCPHISFWHTCPQVFTNILWHAPCDHHIFFWVSLPYGQTYFPHCPSLMTSFVQSQILPTVLKHNWPQPMPIFPPSRTNLTRPRALISCALERHSHAYNFPSHSHPQFYPPTTCPIHYRNTLFPLACPIPSP